MLNFAKLRHQSCAKREVRDFFFVKPSWAALNTAFVFPKPSWAASNTAFVQAGFRAVSCLRNRKTKVSFRYSNLECTFYLQGTQVVEKGFNQTWAGALRLRVFRVFRVRELAGRSGSSSETPPLNQFYLARRSNSTQLNWSAWKGSMQ